MLQTEHRGFCAAKTAKYKIKSGTVQKEKRQTRKPAASTRFTRKRAQLEIIGITHSVFCQ
jgi:hypothetical protein